MGAAGHQLLGFQLFPKLMFHLPSSRLSYDIDDDDDDHSLNNDDDDDHHHHHSDDNDDDDDNESASSRLQRVIGHRSIATQPLSFIKLQMFFKCFLNVLKFFQMFLRLSKISFPSTLVGIFFASVFF